MGDCKFAGYVCSRSHASRKLHLCLSSGRKLVLTEAIYSPELDTQEQFQSMTQKLKSTGEIEMQFTDKPLANFSLFPPLQYCGWNPESSALYQWAATPGLSQFLINRYTVLTSEGLLGVTNVATLDVKRINYSILFMRRLPYLGYRLIHVDPLFWSWFRWSWCCWCGWCVCRATRWFLCWCFSSLWFSFRRNLNMHMKSFQYK